MLGGGGLRESGRHDAVDGVKLAVRGFGDEDGVGAEDGLEALHLLRTVRHRARAGTGAGSDFWVCT